jgi:hypothetical protein
LAIAWRLRLDSSAVAITRTVWSDMPTTRKRLSRIGVPRRITSEVVEAWRNGNEREVDYLLGVGGHLFSVFDVDDNGRVLREPLLASPEGTDLGWEVAVRLRRELVAICPPGKTARERRRAD